MVSSLCSVYFPPKMYKAQECPFKLANSYCLFWMSLQYMYCYSIHIVILKLNWNQITIAARTNADCVENVMFLWDVGPNVSWSLINMYIPFYGPVAWYKKWRVSIPESILLADQWQVSQCQYIFTQPIVFKPQFQTPHMGIRFF